MQFLNNCTLLKEVQHSLPFDIKWNDSLKNPFYACTNIADWRISIEIKPDLIAQIGEEKLCFVIYTLLKHEEGHWRMCPFDGQYHLTIMSSVTSAFKKVFGRKTSQTEELYCGLAVNMFEDLVVDRISILTEPIGKYKKGMEIILLEVLGDYRKASKDIYRLMYNLRESFLLDKKVNDNEINEILKTLKGDLNARDNWQEKSYKFAEKIFQMISLIENEPEKGAKDILEEIQSVTEQLTSESIQAKKMKNDDTYRADEVKKYFDGKNEGKTGAKDLSGIWSPFIDRLEVLDLFFEKKAEDVKLEYYTQSVSLQPITYLGKKKLPDEIPFRMSRIKWPATRIIAPSEDKENITVHLYEKDTPFNLEGNQIDHKTLFDLSFILDSSGSMGLLNEAHRPYHKLVIAIYSLLSHLRQTGTDIYINYCVVNFSSKTWYSGWKEYKGMKELKKNYILKQQLGGTMLNPKAFETMINESKGPFLSIMVTDSYFENGSEVIDAIRNLVSKGNELCLITIGPSDASFSEGVRQAGGTVYSINNVSDLSGLILKKGKEYW